MLTLWDLGGWEMSFESDVGAQRMGQQEVNQYVFCYKGDINAVLWFNMNSSAKTAVLVNDTIF